MGTRGVAQRRKVFAKAQSRSDVWPSVAPAFSVCCTTAILTTGNCSHRLIEFPAKRGRFAEPVYIAAPDVASGLRCWALIKLVERSVFASLVTFVAFGYTR